MPVLAAEPAVTTGLPAPTARKPVPDSDPSVMAGLAPGHLRIGRGATPPIRPSRPFELPTWPEVDGRHEASRRNGQTARYHVIHTPVEHGENVPT